LRSVTIGSAICESCFSAPESSTQSTLSAPIIRWILVLFPATFLPIF
jgi:hypothetical protein